jgi:hypothetical protein
MAREFDFLKGQRIVSVYFAEDLLTFGLATGNAAEFKAYGECCSNSYVEDMDNPDIFEDAVFLDVQIEEGNDDIIEEDFVVNKWTFYKFTTDKGMCTLSFRNESNGFYNGWLERVC